MQSLRAIRIAMTHYAGLDVSVRTTSVCIVDEAGKVVREKRIPTEPAAIIAVLQEAGVSLHRIGLEAGPLSQWLFGAMIEAGLPAICVETRHMKLGGDDPLAGTAGEASSADWVSPVMPW